jgi:hypothetical protein
MPVSAVLDLGSTLPDQQWFYDMAGTSILLDSAEWEAWLADAEQSAFRVITPHSIYTVRREQRFGHWRWYAYPQGSRSSRHKRVSIGATSDLTASRLRDIGRAFGTEQGP